MILKVRTPGGDSLHEEQGLAVDEVIETLDELLREHDGTSMRIVIDEEPSNE